ncbi:MAG TPA: DMT family transporter [Ramlibacter sp.]|nr:DMT family transporter [Ramlibacter sp.]
MAGVALAVGAVACFGALDTTTKFVSASVPLLMALWCRYAFQALLTTATVLPQRGMSVLRTRNPRFQWLRGVLLLSSSLLAFASLKYMPVGEFTAIMMIAPLAVTVLAATLLKEQVSPLRWILVAGGFAGTLVIIRPGGEAFQWASLLPLGLVVCNAWFQVLTSKMARTEDPVTMHLYTGWVGTLLATLALPFVWTTLPHWWLWLALSFMGLMGAIGHFMLILAYQRAPASTLTPYLYAQIAFAMLGGWLVFSHVPDAWSMFGILAIAICGAGGAWLTVRETRLALEPVEA